MSPSCKEPDSVYQISVLLGRRKNFRGRARTRASKLFPFPFPLCVFPSRALSHGAKKHYQLVLFWARALQSFYFLYVFFHGVCKRCNKPKRSGEWTHKYRKTALLFITRFLYWTFLYILCLIGIVFRYLFVLTYFDSSRRHTHAKHTRQGHK